MSGQMNRGAFQQLITENLTWLHKVVNGEAGDRVTPHSLEYKHIVDVLQDSVQRIFDQNQLTMREMREQTVAANEKVRLLQADLDNARRREEWVVKTNNLLVASNSALLEQLTTPPSSTGPSQAESFNIIAMLLGDAYAAKWARGEYTESQMRQRVATFKELTQFTAEERGELNGLRQFKKYVHERLDKANIPTDPEPDNTKASGCRIEGRLNFVLQREAAANALAEATATLIELGRLKAIRDTFTPVIG